ncbi:hypothetical protein [Microbacterium sp.]|uniref:hypothetical protein n=1 Tax=Microbacterium sp. TaxID=51671 RepID=UPI0039E71A43
MTEPQVWTLIGVFAAAMFGMITIVSTLFVGIVRAEIGGVRAEIGRLADKVDHLDGDVQALMRHTFGIERG